MSEASTNPSDCRTIGTVGGMLRCFRERRLWTQATLAERAGLPEKTISSLETGARRKPHLTTLELLADALELDATEREALQACRDARPQPPAPPPLPLATTSFVGREKPVRDVLALLEAPEIRLLTLTGPGGIGKTRLAQHVAEEVVDRFPDGAFVVELAAVRDPALVPGAIGQAIGLRIPGGQPVEGALFDYCSGRRLLLVLDNIEQVLGTAAFVDRLLAVSPELTVLVTGRERLALSREYVYHVGALTLPDPTVADPDRIGASEAVQLFALRARAVQPGFAVTAANAADVAAICVGLDGIPLAIELAAARLAHVGSPTVLRDRLDRRLAWLSTGLRDKDPRHRTMRAAIEWSYDVLDPAEQRLFRRLSVFAGGFTIDAVDALAAVETSATASGADGRSDASGLDPTLDGIASLVEKNLLQLHDGPDGGTRYRMLETIREFGVERLRESGEEAPVRSAHGASFLALAERGDAELGGPNQAGWLARLEAEGDNLRAALAWAVAQGDAERASRLGSALWRFWAASGRVEEGRRFLAQALALDGPIAPAIRAKALRRLGNLAMEQADYTAARDAFAASLELARATGDEAARARALGSVGHVACILGDYVHARACLEEALAVWDTPDSTADRAVAFFSLGEIAFATGRSAEAEGHYRASLHVRRALGDEFGAAHAAVCLGRLARVAGRLAEARTLLEDALEVFRVGSDRTSEGYALLELAQIARAEGDAAAALDLTRRTLALRHALGDLHGTVDALEVFAQILWDRGAGEDGALLAGAAAGWRRERGVPLVDPLRSAYDAALARARAALGEQAFNAAWAAGESMPAQRAAARALALAT